MRRRCHEADCDDRPFFTDAVEFGRARSERGDGDGGDVPSERPRCWWGDWAQPPWIPLVGDADGDGRADLVAVEPPGGTISVERTSPLGKWVQDPEPNIRFGNDVVAAAVGPFTGDAADELLALGRDGSLRLAFGMKRGTRTYTRVERVGEVPTADLPMSVARAFSADINHDGRIDVLVPRGDGRLLVLLNRPGDGGRPRFDRSLALGAPSDATEIDVGTFGAPARQRLIWVDADGRLNAATLALAGAGLQVGSPERCSKSARRASGGGKVPRPRRPRHHRRSPTPPRRRSRLGRRDSSVPTTAEWKTDAWWRPGDIDGNGMDDLVRKRTLPASAGGPEVSIQFAARRGEAQQGFLDDDLDGLPDAWEQGAIRPGGLDLKVLGCKPGRKDVIVEIERFDNVDVPLLRTEVGVTVRYFASLPVANPDGSRGIAAPDLFSAHTARRLRQRPQAIRRAYPSYAHRGVVHSAFFGVESEPGFANALLMGDRGKFRVGLPVHDVMTHEFGHELSLPHDAFQPHNCPIYNSVMSYTYIEGAGHRLDLCVYSEGRFRPWCSTSGTCRSGCRFRSRRSSSWR